jgi:hypothetical protein
MLVQITEVVNALRAQGHVVQVTSNRTMLEQCCIERQARAERRNYGRISTTARRK